MRFSTLLFIIISFSALTQERRLALVIGNSNYEKGPLQNPVNDALLMKETLEDLDFDVILDTNIATFSDFKNAIRLYGDSRDKYNVGFIYYAGHAVQINDVNYLLATKENYLSELDVEFNALSVQYIMRFLTSRTDEVNVLMLDACRDNPFEQNWNPKARSTEGGRGLAQIAPPTGSLVAYSTDAGNTAADGSGKNSIYCLSLIKNMVIENVTLDQVFRNVRADVLESSNGRQRPVEASQLTGDAFYLKKSTFTDQIIEIDSLIDVENYSLAREKTSSILTLDPNNKQALLRKGRIEYNTIGQDYDGKELNKAAELYKNDPEIHEYLARFYSTIGKQEEALTQINLAIKLDSNYAQYYQWKAMINKTLEFYEDAIRDYTKAIQLDPENGERYYNRAKFFIDFLDDPSNALIDYSKAIELSPKNVNYYYARGLLYADYLKKDEKAIKDFEKVLEIDPADVSAINAIGLNYQEQGKPDLAIAQYEKGIALEKSNPFAAAFCFSNRAVIYADQGKLEEALKDYSKAIQLDPENGERYYNRANFFIDFLDEPSDALIDYSKAIELNPRNVNYYYLRGVLYDDYLNQDEKALIDYEKVLEIDPADVDAINVIGLNYQEQGKPDLAIAQYEKGIALEKSKPVAAAFCYGNRALIYADQGKLDDALKDYSKAIQLDSDNDERYYNRANFFLDYLDELNNALIDYSKAIELSPKNVNYYYARGLLYDDYLKKDEKAIKDYEKILEIDSLDIQAINAIGLIYEENEKWDLAQKQYEKGILWEDVNPQAASFCYINRAGLFVKKDKYEDALLDYNKAIELDPFSGMKYYFRGDFFSVVKNDNNRALLDYSMAIHFEPNNLDFLHDRGLFYKKITEYEKAKEDLLKTLEIDSAFAMSFNSLGTIYQQEGDNEKALEYYQRGIESEGIDQNTIAFCYSNKGLIKSSLGQFEEAEIAYNGAILAEPENSEWYSDMALFHSTYSGKYQVSLTNINKAIKLDPNEASYYITRSYIHFLLNDKKTQLKDINRAIELEPDVPDWYCERGLYYEQNGEIEKAINEFNFGYALDSTYYNPLIHKAKTLMINNEFQEAINTLEMVIQIDPNDPEPYFLKGRIYENMHDTTKAIMNYSLSQGKLENYDYYISNNLGLEMNIGEYYVNLGDFYSKLGEKEIMCEYYNKASSSLADEYKFRCQELKKTLQEKLNQYCNY